MLGQHKRAVLQFSGGKDSTALLYLARPYLDRITVFWVDAGAAFPHVARFITETCRALTADLRVVSPAMPVRSYMEQVGLPSDVVPVEATKEMSSHMSPPPPQLIQSYVRCCGTMLWEPMQKAVKETDATLVLRGLKKSDARRGVPPGHIHDGIEYGAPLWDWTDADIMAFLDREGVVLPEHYAAGVNDSLDCWLCSAHLAHGGIERLIYTRDHYPDLWPEIADRIRRVGTAVASAPLAKALEVANG